MQLAPNDAYTSNVPPPAFPRRATVLLPAVALGRARPRGRGRPRPTRPRRCCRSPSSYSTIATLWSVLSSEEGRRWADAIPPARLALFHVWRLAPGIAFLVLYGHGWLPRGFAVPGGVGDVAVALSAPLAAWAAGRPGRSGQTAYLVWNVLGFLDLANVVRAAAVLTLADPGLDAPATGAAARPLAGVRGPAHVRGAPPGAARLLAEEVHAPVEAPLKGAIEDGSMQISWCTRWHRRRRSGSCRHCPAA